jgi:hypothetical protein
MSKRANYFSHDYNTRADEKIKKLIKSHGMAGYGIFWSIVEDLYNNENDMKADFDDFAYELRTDSKLIRSIICDFGLFIIENGCFGSASVQRRLDERIEKSEKARLSAFKRWGTDAEYDANASDNDTNALEIDANALEIDANATKIDAIKKERKKESKESKESIAFIPPTLEEVKAYFKENGYTEASAIKAFNHYDADDWNDVNGKPVKNWKRKMNGVWFKPENKIAVRKLIMP